MFSIPPVTKSAAITRLESLLSEVKRMPDHASKMMAMVVLQMELVVEGGIPWEAFKGSVDLALRKTREWLKVEKRDSNKALWS